MSSNLSSWYNNSYNGPWSRTSQLRVAPFIATSALFTPNPLSEPSNTMSSTAPGGIHAGGGIINAIGPSGYPLTAAEIAANAAAGVGFSSGDGTPGSEKAGKRRLETFFGPDVGVDVDAEKGWLGRDAEGAGAHGADGSSKGEKLPLSVVKGWIEKSKAEETVHPTTTLQALVNLKRPTLSLIAITSPVSAETVSKDFAQRAVGPGAVDEVSPVGSGGGNVYAGMDGVQRHALRFLYDASSPLVRITLSLHHRPTSPAFYASGPTTVIHSSVRPAGFGRVFELSQEEAIDLERGMERERISVKHGRDSQDGESVDTSDEKDLKGSTRGGLDDQAAVVPEFPSSAASGGENGSVTGTQPNVLAGPAVIAAAREDADPNRRTGLARLNFLSRRRNRQTDDLERGLNGIELQPTVTNDPSGAANAPTEPTPDQEAQKAAEEEGIRVLIRIDALDADGKPLTNANAQLNHILVTGGLVASAAGPTDGTEPPAAVVDSEAEGLSSEQREALQAKEEEEAIAPKKWVWMVKVVRREAVIGTYTFLLKEIYGLSSTSGADDKAAGTIDAYPTADPSHNTPEDPYASTSNECIVCLTNPRDVVLLPCRHLVVCRECAVGMVEFGAGGKVARREEAPAVATGDATTTDATGATTEGGAAAAVPAPVVPAPAPTRERRRKKAKGWFCPVCRQSYTSLLRLALPSTLTPREADEAVEHALSRVPSRASHHTLRRVSSRATIATLPARGEELLESMLPAGARDVEDDEAADVQRAAVSQSIAANVIPEPSASVAPIAQGIDQRPQFVLGDPLDGSAIVIADKEMTQVEEEALRNKKAEGELRDVPL